MKRKKMDLEIVNPNAAGIDVGSRSHYVAIGQRIDDVREFGVCALDHEEIISWLKECGIKTVAMESTGSYWQNLFSALQISGGKILSSRIPKGSNRLKTALRQAANCIGNMKNANLHNFFIRICIRKGRTAAITATARKLAIIIWNMVVKMVPYRPPNQYEFLDRKRKRKVREMRKLVAKLNILPSEIGFANKCISI